MTPVEIIKDRMIAVSQDNNGIRYSDDDGNSWKPSNIVSGNWDKPIYLTTVGSDNTENIVVVTRALENTANVKGVIYSVDGGRTWSPCGGLEDIYYNRIIKTAGNKLMMSSGDISSNNVVSYTSDDGITWTTYQGVPNTFYFTSWKEPYEDYANPNAYLAGHGDSGRDLCKIFNCKPTELGPILRNQKINQADYIGLKPGDYVDLGCDTPTQTILTYAGKNFCDTMSVYNGSGTATGEKRSGRLRMVIAAFDQYNFVGDNQNSGHGIVLMMKYSLLNQSWNNWSADRASLASQIAAALGVDSLKTIRRSVSGEWRGDTIFEPTEVECFGSHFYSKNLDFETSVQWEIMKYTSARQCTNPWNDDSVSYKSSEYARGSRRWWWEDTGSRLSGNWCYCRHYGYAGDSPVDLADGSCRPCVYL